MLELGLKFTLAYCLGAVLGSLVVGTIRGAEDVRSVGSGNPGATNALRAHGKLFALCVLIIDVGKGILAVLVIPRLSMPGVGIDPEIDRSLITYAVAFAAILGHVFPIWFGFRGGKGGATAAGLLCYFLPILAAPLIGAWALVAYLTGFVGLATISASVAAAVFVGITGLPEQPELFVFASLVAALIIYTHRDNIRRMLSGTEFRFGRR